MHIDVHSHFLPRNCFDMIDNKGKHYGPTIVINVMGHEEMMLGGINFGPIVSKMSDIETRLKDMDDTGIDIQILSANPGLLYYDYDSDACLWFSRLQNDGIAKAVKQYPNRFLGMATVPLQDPPKALVELDRAVNELGLRGVEILSNINGQPLDEPELFPFYKEVETLDIPIFIHPGSIAGAERMKKHYLFNLIGNPLDTTLAVAHLIFGGILDKFPSLKVCLAHGGGNLPYIRGRLEHGYEMRSECRTAIKRPPSYYLPLLYFDTITHFIPALEYLVSTIGTDKVMIGTDYPYDMGDPRPMVTVQNLVNVSERRKQQIMGGNAAHLFKI